MLLLSYTILGRLTFLHIVTKCWMRCTCTLYKKITEPLNHVLLLSVLVPQNILINTLLLVLILAITKRDTHYTSLGILRHLNRSILRHRFRCYTTYTVCAPFLHCLQHMIPTGTATISTPKMTAMTPTMIAKTKISRKQSVRPHKLDQLKYTYR